jgi:hypothetical protein
MAELLIGCGNSRVKKLQLDGDSEWKDLTTLDMNPAHNPDVLWDLEKFPYPFHPRDNRFDEIHAYDVLEHTGQQGDWFFFFRQWTEFWKLLKPGGLFFATTPMPLSHWAWGDPGHKRIICAESLVFLSQKNYAEQVGKTSMCDYRPWWGGDFVTEYANGDGGDIFSFILRAIK